MKLEPLENAALRAYMGALGWTHWRPFARACRNPRETQRRLLRDLLRRNRETAFGREHRFEAVDDYDAFAAAVPVQTYESLRPYIERQQETGEPALTAAPPVLYAQTSGTTGKPKFVPLLEETLADYKRMQATQSYGLFCVEPEIFYGRILGIVSPAVEGRLPNGAPYGSASGHVYQTMPRRARRRYVLPEEALAGDDYETKYRVIAALALTCPDLSCIATANPSTLLKLVSVFREHRETLLRDIAAGTLSCADRLTPAQRAAVLPRLRCSAERKAELQSLLRATNPSVSDIWPRLRMVTTWTGGSCGIALGAVRKMLPPSVRIAELGYMASEFRGTITVDIDKRTGAPTIQQNFFEFVERGDWDNGRPRFQTVESLREGGQYYIFVTTSGGLYRYFMNDVVEACGRFEDTPCIRFLQKGVGVTSITGEKLYESQIIEAVRAAETPLGLASAFFIMLADAQSAVYRLCIEWPEAQARQVDLLRAALERELGARNVEYAQKRKSGRLRPLEIAPLRRGAGQAYKQHCVARGQREIQFKIVALQYADDCPFPFGEFTLEPAAA